MTRGRPPVGNTAAPASTPPPAPFSLPEHVAVPPRVAHLTRSQLRRSAREREQMLDDLQRQSFGYFLHEVTRTAASSWTRPRETGPRASPPSAWP